MLLENLTGNVKKKLNAHDDEDLSALHYAARFNHLPVVKLLVESKAGRCHLNVHMYLF